MFSTSILGLLFGLLIVQTHIAVSALPTSSTITTTGAQFETIQASGSNKNNNNNNRGNGYGPNNTTTSKSALPLPIIHRFDRVVTSFTREYTTQTVWSQFDKRDNSEDQKHDSNDMSLGEILATVIAALTLLAAIIPLFRYPQFRHWVSSTISPAVKKALGIKPLSSASAALEGPSAIPTPIPHSVHTQNDYSNAHPISTSSDTFLCNRDGLSGEDGGVQLVEESLALKRPKPVATCPLQ